MSNYTFSTLNDREFEELAKDALNAKFKFDLQSFKQGKDQGIDLRYSSPLNKNEIVVQAKHYLKTGYKGLYRGLKNEEVAKVKNIAPATYLIVTSVDLSAKEKDDISALFTPFLKSSQDILAKNDLNDIISEHPEIEKKHFKLWLSSTNVLENIFHNGIIGRSEYLVETIQRKLPFYVITKELNTAFNILNENKILLITGQPGVGKTTLAQMVIYKLLGEGVKLYDVTNVAEAEGVLSRDPEAREVFYFDDFLGTSYSEIVEDKMGSQLARFIERIRHTPNKYMVLTTRTVVYKDAALKHEKLATTFGNLSNVFLDITGYDLFTKAKILYNHLWACRPDKVYIDEIFRDKFYNKIIRHKNFTPRLVEFFTDNIKRRLEGSEHYQAFILRNLDQPEEIWKNSFNNQISDVSKCFLIALLLEPSRGVRESVIERAFISRLHFEKEFSGIAIESDVFNKTVQRLLDGFIKADLKYEGRAYDFINPSLRDYLIRYINSSSFEKEKIVRSAYKLEQLKLFSQYEILSLDIGHDEELLINKVKEIVSTSVEQYTGNELDMFLLDAINLLYNNRKTSKGYALAILEFIRMSDLSIPAGSFEPIIWLIDYHHRLKVYKEFVKDNFNALTFKMLSSVYSHYGANGFQSFFKNYGYHFDDFVNEHIDVVLAAVDRISDSILAKVIDSNQYPDEGEEVDLVLEEAAGEVNRVKAIFFPNTEANFEFDINTPKIQSFINHFNDWQNYMLANSGPGNKLIYKREVIDKNTEIDIENLFSSPSTLDS
jgi:DNA polymerase III delta prime subunit